MPIKDQVTNQELSLKLKSLGVLQKSMFSWVKDDLDNKYLVLNENMPVVCAGYNRMQHSSAEDYVYRKNVEIYSAFTVGELVEMLSTFNENDYGRWFITNFENTFHCRHRHIPVARADTKANAHAKMLIYLLEKGLITLPSNTK